MSSVDIEIALRDTADNSCLADIILRPPGGNADAILARNIPVKIDIVDLLSRALDPNDYGTALTAMLFASSKLREAWIKSTTYSLVAEIPLRIHLRIDAESSILHSLRWETLHDPETQTPLCFSRRVLLSRYLDVGDLGRVPTLRREKLRALVLVASPEDIESFNLAPIDVAGEVQRVRSALSGISLTVLASSEGLGTASLTTLVDVLEQGYPIVYIACHGALRRDEPILYLEDKYRNCARVSGTALVRAIANLSTGKRPLLIVLAVCRSNGNGADEVLGALGPRLAKAGVAAVVGMQGDVPMRTVEQLMPRFFASLLADGAIDQAMALARASLDDDEPWWMPVLYLRARDGRIWHVDDDMRDSQTVMSSLHALSHLVQERAELHAILTAYRADFEVVSSQVGVVTDYKQFHDLFQQLESVVILLHFASKRLPEDTQAWEELEVNEPEAQRLITALLKAADQVSFVDEVVLWRHRLRQIRDNLRLSIKESDDGGLRQVISRLETLLSAQLIRINGGLVGAARMLHLMALAHALTTVRTRTTAVSLPPHLQVLLTNVVSGVEALERLAQRLANLVRIHDIFQELDNELRGARVRIERQPEVLNDVWPELKSLVTHLVTQEAGWRNGLAESAAGIEKALVLGELVTLRRSFVRFAGQVGQSFNQVDHDLLNLCNDLRTMGQPLYEIVTRLAQDSIDGVN